VNDYAAAGLDLSNLSPSEQKQLAGVVVRALGMTRQLDVEVRTSSVEEGDVFALLSDSLLDALGEGLLHALLHEHRNDLHAGVRALLDTGKANGGTDALTVVLAAASKASQPASVAARSEIT
jgi:serine/threonine protein phosphatase PrpC